jgi:hypothetical protein
MVPRLVMRGHAKLQCLYAGAGVLLQDFVNLSGEIPRDPLLSVCSSIQPKGVLAEGEVGEASPGPAEGVGDAGRSGSVSQRQ